MSTHTHNGARLGGYQFATTPMTHQAQALRAIIERKGVCGLLCDPGVGKSKPIIDYMGLLWTKRGQVDWMVTVPLNALDTWPQEFSLHLPDSVPLELIQLDGRYSIATKIARIEALAKQPGHGKLRVVLINHDAFASKARMRGTATKTMQDGIVEAIGLWQPDGVTVDEVHRLKSHTANRAVGLRRVGEMVPKRQILTGTVSPKNPLDIYSQWKFLNPDRFDKRWADFCRRYAVWGGFEGRQPTRFVRQDQMREKIKQDAFIATKEQCLDLPATTDRTVPVDLGKTEAKVYRELGQHLMAELPSGQTAIAPIVLTKVLRLRQVTGGFLGYEDDYYKPQTEELGTSKLDVLADLLKDLFDAQEKVVIYAHFRPDIQRICDMLARRFGSIPTFRVEGQTAHKARLSARQGFAATEGAAAMVAQQRTMSLAVNELVASSHAVFYSLSERRDDYDQAKDRLHRQGQTRPVTFHHLVVPNSVDTMLLSAHRDKIALENALLQNRRALTLDGQ